MSFSIQYKRLFQVQLLHGFYLNRADRVVDFAPANNPAFAISQLLEILPTTATRQWISGHRARLLIDQYGCSVAIRVAETGAPPNVKHELQVPMDVGESLTFGLKPVSPDWKNYSNCRLRANLPAIHFFSNLNLSADLIAPFLARPLAAYNNKRAYEMGEPVRTNQAVYVAKRAITTKQNPSGVGGIHWQRLFVFNQNLPHQFCSSEDEVLLPHRFYYTFTPLAGENIKKGSVVLSTSGNNNVKTIAFDEANPIARIALDYSDVPSGWYTLKVSSDSGYEDTRKVLLNDELYDPALFAVLQIGHQANLGGLRLLEADGSLRRNGSSITEAPVFKILIKNRHTYWQYVLNQSNPPNPAGNADVEFLDPATKKRLVTKEPMPLSRSLAEIFFQHDKPATSNIDETVLLPNPDNLLIHEDELGRYYSEIYLSKIKT